MLKLNSLSNDIFAATDTFNGKKVDATTVKLNARSEAESNITLNRREIVASGRMCAVERIGKIINSNKYTIEKYKSRLDGAESVSYEDLQRSHTKSKALFCAAIAARNLGIEAPRDMDELRKTPALLNGTFFQAMAAIDVDVLSPIYFSVMNDIAMGLMEWREIPLGGTGEVTVRSNDVFLFEDGSWGSGHSTSKDYLYAKTITLNPTMYTCNATIKWYQDVVAGDAGEYYTAIMLGLYNKAYAKMISVLSAATTGNTYIPSGLTSDTYSTENWLNITQLVAAANGVRVDDLMAIGTPSALSNVLPVDNTGGAMTGLQYGLGEAWFYNGYLPKAAGVDLFPVTPVIVPGTQNSTLETIDTGDNIYIVSKAGYRPIIGGYYEGTPITLTATPSGGNGYALGTADFTIDINVGATMDIKPLFASKVGVIESTYGS